MYVPWRWLFKISIQLIQVKILRNRLTPLQTLESNPAHLHIFSLRKQPTFRDSTTGFPAKWHLRNERRNSILMTRHYRDQISASDWLCRERNLLQPIRSTTQTWVVTRHQFMEFCARYSDVISRERQWKSREKPAVLLGQHSLSSDAIHIWIFSALNPALNRMLI